jgi:hypothetical protein
MNFICLHWLAWTKLGWNRLSVVALTFVAWVLVGFHKDKITKRVMCMVGNFFNYIYRKNEWINNIKWHVV